MVPKNLSKKLLKSPSVYFSDGSKYREKRNIGGING